MTNDDNSLTKHYRSRLDGAQSYGEIWEVVKDSVESFLKKRRSNMMLFLDDLPIQLGAYHPIGTNNIVLNRALIQIVEATIESKTVINALVYNLLVHEYLHALGEFSEDEVRKLVNEITRKCFGEEHITGVIARKSPWTLLKGIPLGTINAPKRAMEIVKNFEKTDRYVV